MAGLWSRDGGRRELWQARTDVASVFRRARTTTLLASTAVDGTYLTDLAILFQLRMSPLMFPRPFLVGRVTLSLHHEFDALRDICLCWSIDKTWRLRGRRYAPCLNVYGDTALKEGWL